MKNNIHIMENYIQNIKRIREQKGISQDYMAMELGISQSTYTKLERGEVNLYVDRLLKIAKVLNIGLARIFDENANNSFNVNTYDTSSNFNQVIENQYNDSKELIKKLQNTLESENQHLKEEVVFLRKLVEGKF
ncbi:MAG: helix-turn-helix transcriptional regulator [Flavobacterium haoranii]